LDSEGHIADEGTTSEVIATAKEMAFRPSKKKQSVVSSNKAEEDLTRILSAEEAPRGEDRRTGDTAVYKYYIQTVHPLSALIFFVACSVFVVGLILPREYYLPHCKSCINESSMQNFLSNGGWPETMNILLPI
jgi:hypothetical protein